MKLGFWTLGMPAWTNAEIADRAATLGYDGVDLRCTRRIGVTENANIGIDLPHAEMVAARSVFANKGVEIASLLSYDQPIYDGDGPNWKRFTDHLSQHAELAVTVGSSRVRVVVSAQPPEVSWADHLRTAWEVILGVLDKYPGLDAVIENHPGRASARQLLETADDFGDQRLGVEFSPEHAIVMQEDIMSLIEQYTPYIHQVCIADRRLVQDGLADFDGRYYSLRYESCPVGTGDLPLERIVRLLSERGFDDYLSLKWEKTSRFGHHLPGGETQLESYAGIISQFGVLTGPNGRHVGSPAPAGSQRPQPSQ